MKQESLGILRCVNSQFLTKFNYVIQCGKEKWRSIRKKQKQSPKTLIPLRPNCCMFSSRRILDIDTKDKTIFLRDKTQEKFFMNFG